MSPCGILETASVVLMVLLTLSSLAQQGSSCPAHPHRRPRLSWVRKQREALFFFSFSNLISWRIVDCGVVSFCDRRLLPPCPPEDSACGLFTDGSQVLSITLPVPITFGVSDERGEAAFGASGRSSASELQ